MRGLALPVLDPRQPLAAISIAVRRERISAWHIKELIAALMRQRTAIERRVA